MSEAQMAALNEYKADRRRDPEPVRRTNLFMKLFPNEYPTPSPYYDYFVPSHLIQPQTPRSPPDTEGSQQAVPHQTAALFPIILATAGEDGLGSSFDSVTESIGWPEFLDRSVVGGRTQYGHAESAGADEVQDVEDPIVWNLDELPSLALPNDETMLEDPSIAKPAKGQDLDAFFDDMMLELQQH